jgi:D-alanyl-D-alanine dipeptidase
MGQPAQYSDAGAGHRGPLIVLAALLLSVMGCGPPGDLDWTRGDEPAPAAAVADTAASTPFTIRQIVGDYAALRDTVIVRERDGAVEAILADTPHPLVPLAGNVYTLGEPEQGRHVRFEAGPDGSAETAWLDGVPHRRLHYGTVAGETFRIQPVRPVEVLRREAMAATPPLEENHLRRPDLVDLATLDVDLRFDIRYATTKNFMGAAFYDHPRASLQRPAAEALARAAHRVAEDGFGLLIHDAYRPWFVTWMFWHATPPAQRMFVANPASGSRHNRGAAVDLTLYDLATGQPVPMPSGYDEFSPRASPDYPGGTTAQRHHRDLLRRAMEAEGFRVYHSEWWHFDHRDWRMYPILNLPFEALDPPARRDEPDGREPAATPSGATPPGPRPRLGARGTRRQGSRWSPGSPPSPGRRATAGPGSR